MVGGGAAVEHAPLSLRDMETSKSSGVFLHTLAMAMFPRPTEALILVMNPARRRPPRDNRVHKITGMRHHLRPRRPAAVAPGSADSPCRGNSTGSCLAPGPQSPSFSHARGGNRHFGPRRAEEQEEFGKGSIKGPAAPETGQTIGGLHRVLSCPT